MKIQRISPITYKLHEMDLPITDDQLSRWHSGTLIQDAFPQLSVDDREFLKTGITADEWVRLFAVAE